MSFDVDIIESESGFGQKVDETKHFTTLDEANVFFEEFNEYNRQPENRVPGWYMYATQPHEVVTS